MQLQATTTTINGETVLSAGISGFGIRIQNAADHSLVAVGNSSWLPFNINTQPDFEAVPVKQSGVELMASEFNATMTMVVDSNETTRMVLNLRFCWRRRPRC